MKPAIHYAFKARLIRRSRENGEFDFIDVFQEFFDDEPIKAREQAFKCYQNYIDVLLESKGLKYISDLQTREAMGSFYDPQTTHLIKYKKGGWTAISDAYGNGIGVFLAINDVFDEVTVDPLSREKMIMVHGLGFLYEGFWSWQPDGLAKCLEREYNYYQHFGYETGNYKTSILVYDSVAWVEKNTEDQPQRYIILRTPFDWTGYDKEFWWGDLSDVVEDFKPSTVTKSIKPALRSIKDVIASGEKNTVEFKPSLLYNFKSNSAGIGVKGIIAKSICGFLNSDGGILLIGVKDNGNIQGLSYDFSLAGEKDVRDFFRLEFDDTIKQFLPAFIKGNISGEFYKIKGVEIFVVIVFPSKSKPIFMNGKDGKEFWVRWTASTRQYKDMEEIVNYCLEHWGKDE